MNDIYVNPLFIPSHYPMTIPSFSQDHSIIPSFSQDYPMIIPRFSQDSPKIIPRFSQDSPKILPRFSQDSPKILSRFSQDSPKILSRFSQDYPKILPRFCQDSPKILPRFSQDSAKILPRFSQDSPKILPRFSQDSPKILPRFSQDSPKIIPRLSHHYPIIMMIYNVCPRRNFVGTGVHHLGAEVAEGPGAAARRLRGRLQRRRGPDHGTEAPGGAAAAGGEGPAMPGGHGADVCGKCGATHQFPRENLKNFILLVLFFFRFLFWFLQSYIAVFCLWFFLEESGMMLREMADLPKYL